MTEDDVRALTAAFAVDGLRFERGEGGLTRGVIDTPACAGAFYLHGAQVTRWRPAGHDEVLWLSPNATFEDGRAIRGGIPICFPWFGAHPTDPGVPSHGLARTRTWELQDARREGDTVEVRLGTRIERWECRLTASFGDTLTLTLDVQNAGDADATFEAALHSYFTVSDIDAVSISGLEATPFLDLTANRARRAPEGVPIRLDREVDRLYGDVPASVVLCDPARRQVQIEGHGAASIVVWNPGLEKASRLADLGEHEWRRMVCIETASVGDARVALAAGEAHRMTSVIRVTQIP